MAYRFHVDPVDFTGNMMGLEAYWIFKPLSIDPNLHLNFAIEHKRAGWLVPIEMGRAEDRKISTRWKQSQLIPILPPSSSVLSSTRGSTKIEEKESGNHFHTLDWM